MLVTVNDLITVESGDDITEAAGIRKEFADFFNKCWKCTVANKLLNYIAVISHTVTVNIITS